MAPQLPADTTLGPVALTVADLERSLAYWRDEIGLEVQDRGRRPRDARLPGRALLVLVEVPGARRPTGTAASSTSRCWCPSAADLARWLAHAARDRVQLTGASDHDVSEALYLRDPDHHGIEIYADRPRELWEGEVGERHDHRCRSTSTRCSACSTTRRARPFDGLPAGTRMGHVHLRVADVAGGDRVLPRPARLRSDGVAGRAGGVPGRRRLPPPHRREHLGEPRAPAGAGGGGDAAPRTIVLPTAADRDAAVERARAGGAPVEDGEDGTLVRDPSGNAFAARRRVGRSGEDGRREPPQQLHAERVARRAERLQRDVVGARRAVLLDARADRRLVAPRHERVDGGVRPAGVQVPSASPSQRRFAR